MTDSQIEIVKNSWGKIASNSDKLGEILYPKFFLKVPEAQNLFKNDVSRQSKSLFMIILLIITKINRLDTLREELKYLAKRHVGYGVGQHFFKPFGEAFVESILELTNISDTTKAKEMAEAWNALYTIVAEAMVEDMSITK